MDKWHAPQYKQGTSDLTVAVRSWLHDDCGFCSLWLCMIVAMCDCRSSRCAGAWWQPKPSGRDSVTFAQPVCKRLQLPCPPVPCRSVSAGCHAWALCGELTMGCTIAWLRLVAHTLSSLRWRLIAFALLSVVVLTHTETVNATLLIACKRVDQRTLEQG